MKQSILFKILIACMCLFLFCSCGGDDDEVIPQPEPTYSVIEVNYTLEEEGDSVTFATHAFDPIGFINNGKDSLPVEWVGEPRELMMTSLFRFSPSLPEYVGVDTVTVSTPEWVRGNEIDTFNRGWTLTEGVHTKPYWSSVFTAFTQTLRFKVPPHKEFVINRTSKEEILQATVELVVENDLTGERTSYKGKWVGTLRYLEHATALSEKDWSSE